MAATSAHLETLVAKLGDMELTAGGGQDVKMRVTLGNTDHWNAQFLRQQAALFRKAAEMTKPVTDKVSSAPDIHHSYDVRCFTFFAYLIRESDQSIISGRMDICWSRCAGSPTCVYWK